MEKILLKVYPQLRPEEALHGLLFYFLLIDVFSRFFLQDLPVISIQNYLHLPIKKSKLIHYLLLRSLSNLNNLGMLLIFVPFMANVLLPAYGAGVSLAWLAAMVLLTLCNNFLLTLPYGLLDTKILPINLISFLFNIGVNVFVVFYFSIYNKSRIDLSKNASFNWEGMGASQLALSMLVSLVPVLIYVPFGVLGIPYWGIFTLGILGVLGLAFHQQLLQMTANRFQKHKYSLAAGFRMGN